MPDREKVIRALECCKNHFCPTEDCPYDYDPDMNCADRLMRDALALLKEQEAVEPEKEDDGTPEPWTVWWYVCGDCGQPIDKMDRYCRGCGKQVKWK